MSDNGERHISDLEQSIGYAFRDKKLIRIALTHSSFVKGEHREARGTHNERLEFLGDAVLQLVVSAYLFKTHPEMKEGQLTRMRSSLVCEKGLYKAAKILGVPGALFLSVGEEHTGGRDKPSIVSDAMEAIIGAVYLDGGIESASTLILDKIVETLAENRQESDEKDFKTRLQEYVHKAHLGQIAYETVSAEGPEHCRIFTMRVTVNGIPAGIGTGANKQEAGQNAAKEALRILATGGTDGNKIATDKT